MKNMLIAFLLVALIYDMPVASVGLFLLTILVIREAEEVYADWRNAGKEMPSEQAL